MEDVHFLSRLSRVNESQVSLALSLYRNADLVRWILDHFTLPEGAERVAISLEPGQEGPYLIVTREGRFVTCLGAGMSVGDLPVVNRQKLDSLSARYSDFKNRLKAAQEMSRERGVRQLLGRVLTAGDELSREEFIAISAWHSVLSLDFSRLSMDLAGELSEDREALLRLKQARREYRIPLHNYWRKLHALGHLIVLSHMGGAQPWMEAIFALRHREQVGHLTWHVVRQGISSLAIRAAWGIGRIGKPALPLYKSALSRMNTPLSITNVLLPLGALALGHSKLTAEIRKAITPPSEEDISRMEGIEKIAGIWYHICGRLLHVLFQQPEGGLLLHREFGRTMAHKFGQGLPKDHPYHFAKPEDVPEDLAHTLVSNLHLDFVKEEQVISILFWMLPWAARAKAEDLYLPAAYIKATHRPWEPKDTLDILGGFRKNSSDQEPIRAEPKPGRNEPCHCGSGKKFKKCHGA